MPDEEPICNNCNEAPDECSCERCSYSDCNAAVDSVCTCCEQCEVHCSCYHCNCCCEPSEDPPCEHCELCSECCSCAFCPGCSDIMYDNNDTYDYCGECECCHSCCECERCEDCGDRIGDCECSSQGILCYSACPIRRLSYRWPDRLLNLFGIEIEMSKWSHDEQDRANEAYCSIADNHSDLLPRSDGYQITSRDASLVGGSCGECKTTPLTVLQHSAIHYSLLTGSDKDLMNAFLERSPGKQARLMLSALRARPERRWMAGSKSWTNDSCGMHINVNDALADPGTWLKLMHFLLNSPNHYIEQIGGRPPSHYCHTHYGRGARKPKWYTCHTRLRQNEMYHNLLSKWRAYRMSQPVCEGSSERTEFEFSKQHLQKHAVMSRREWGGYEFRLFRSSSNPLRILGNCEMIVVMLAHFENVPWWRVAASCGTSLVSLKEIGATAAKLRHQFPYAAALCSRSGNALTEGFQEAL